MTLWRRRLWRSAWKKKPGILLAIVVIASSSVVLAVPSPAFATTPGRAKTSSVFGGYVKTLRGSPRERAQADFTVPTVTCNEESNQAVLISQYMSYDTGDYVLAFVIAECDSGTATYGAGATCLPGGCSTSESSGCGAVTPVPVSPGDSIRLSETVGYLPNKSAVTADVVDTTNPNNVGCTEFDVFPEQPGSVETGMCPTQPLGGIFASSSSPPQNPWCGLAGQTEVPNVTPVTFTGVTVDKKVLGSRDPGRYGYPARYDYVNGTTLELKTGKLKDSGESFRMSYV